MKKSHSLCVVVIFLCCMFLNGCSKSNQLLEAIEAENIGRVTSLLDEGIDPNEMSLPLSSVWSALETSPQRPLAAACKTGNREIVEVLIGKGATAEYVEGTGWSPLMETLWYYHPDDVGIVSLLLENGADPSQHEGDSLPIFVAADMIPKKYDKNRSNGTVFENDYDKETAQGITDIVILLLGNQSVDIVSNSGMTLLMRGARAGNICLVEYLLKNSCNTEVTDDFGKTAFDYAVENGHTEIVSLLKKYEENNTGDGSVVSR